ncbi:hypothetical protein G7Z17_g11169 [Cylindrodendrum hubeiense]|uniref:Uncharacterized protein n=1 Tax=Cylindrodendrum hubeiense TaxID=595255 RepID=A0A9P5H0Q4_9HYPO|nr:hypothetical protein G7Z17_g11169 [Cylindrodendrum hubeiense]
MAGSMTRSSTAAAHHHRLPGGVASRPTIPAGFAASDWLRRVAPPRSVAFLAPRAAGSTAVAKQAKFPRNCNSILRPSLSSTLSVPMGRVHTVTPAIT